uniref:Uncharacterized protein n=1 Tax=Ditylenchus dipsaci TaxID=166011 RepID=A0A915E8E9_9BILA
MHIRYVQAERTEMIYDEETSDMLDKKMDMKIVAKKFIENLRRTVEELESEKKTLTEKELDSALFSSTMLFSLTTKQSRSTLR